MKRKNMSLYHWSPSDLRPQIIRHGLRPRMHSSAHPEWKAPYVCFADSPSLAWALSGGMPGRAGPEWDLWQAWLYDLAEPRAIRCTDRPSGFYEIRTPLRVPKRHLWHVGTRTVG